MKPYRSKYAVLLFVLAAMLLAFAGFAQVAPHAALAQPSSAQQLFFPVAYMNFQGNTRNSLISIQNVGGAQASVTIAFYNANGQAFTPNGLTLPTGGFQSNPVVLPQGAGFSFNMAEQGQLSSGRYSVVASSDQPLAGVSMVNMATGSGAENLSGMYTGFSSNVGRIAILPIVNKQLNGIGAELSIQNLSNAAANGVIANFYNSAGQQVFSVPLPAIPAYASFQLDVNFQILQIPNGFEGSAVVVSPNAPVVAVNNQFGSGDRGTPFTTSSSWASGATTLFAPFLANNTLGLGAVLTVMNPGSQPVQGTLTYPTGGQPTQQFELAPFARQNFPYQTGAASGVAATVTANQPVVAVVTNTPLSGQPGGSSYDAFTGSSTNMALPHFARAFSKLPQNNYDSTIVLFNPGPATAFLRVGGQGVFQNFPINPNQFLAINGTNGLSGIPSDAIHSLVAIPQQGSNQPQPFFAMVYTQNQNASGDYLSAYASIPVAPPAPPAATMNKTVSSDRPLKAGDLVTYTLSFSAGPNGGNAIVTDDLPAALIDYDYEATPGMVVTPTGEVDYVWEVAVPPAGGVIRVSGVVTSLENILLQNSAFITTSGGASAQGAAPGIVVDVTPPTSEITEKPLSPIASPTATFSFTGQDAAPSGPNSGLAGFECRVDGDAFASCTSPHTTASLAEGEHTFEVRALDLAGNVQPATTSVSWIIDTTPPPVPVLTAPAQSSVITDSDSITLTWDAGVVMAAAETPAGYKVKLNDVVQDVGAVNELALGPLANSVYTWTVAAYDALGNESSYAVERTFTVDKRLVINDGGTSEATFVGTEDITTTIMVPPGAVNLTGTLEIAYEVIPEAELPTPPSEGDLVIGFSLDLLQNGLVQPGVVFSTPITIEIAYDDAQAPDPSKLQLYYLNQDNEWSNDGIVIVTPIGNPLVATLAHLTDFALTGESARKVYLPVLNK